MKFTWESSPVPSGTGAASAHRTVEPIGRTPLPSPIVCRRSGDEHGAHRALTPSQPADAAA